MGCQSKKEFGGCVIDDEASAVLRRIPGMDAIVLATPVYFFGPSAQLKLILDRFYSLCKFDRVKGSVETALKGKIVAVIASSGGPNLDTGLAMIRQTFQTVAGFSGARCEALLVPGAGLSGALAGNKDAREKAIAFGAMLA